MRKSTFLSKLVKLGFGPCIIDNCDTSPNQIRVSCEESGISLMEDFPMLAGDYYGEFRGGYAWINPKLEKLVELAGVYLSLIHI